MFKHVREIDSHRYIVVDKDKNNERIIGIQWADDITGNYEVTKFNKANNSESGEQFCECCKQFITEIKNGNIRIQKEKYKGINGD